MFMSNVLMLAVWGLALMPVLAWQRFGFFVGGGRRLRIQNAVANLNPKQISN